MTSKYQPLAVYLAAQPGDTVTLTFAEVEAVIGAPLPPSADVYHSWWSSTLSYRPQVRAWRGVGWRVQHVALRTHTVTFARGLGTEGWTELVERCR